MNDAASFTKAGWDNATKVDIATFVSNQNIEMLWKDVLPLKCTEQVHWLQPVSREDILLESNSQAGENRK